MTAPAKPLTVDGVAQTKRWLVEDVGYYRFMRVDDETALRLIATIEQQAEQIEKRLAIFRRVRNRFELNGEPPYSDLFKDIRKVLAATEPVNDKR